MKIRCLGCMEEYDKDLNKCPYCSFSSATANSEPYFLVPGAVLDGRYIVGNSLGHSSSAITYIGWDKEINKKVAIKEYFPQNSVTRAMGQNEIQVLDGGNSKAFEESLRMFVDCHNKLSSLCKGIENVAKVKAVFIENSTAYAVSEYVDGVSLKKVLLKTPKIPYADVVELIKPVLEVVQELHNKKIIHSNLSPENILFTRDRKVKLVGFGSWKVQTDENAVGFNLVSKSGYTAPELFGDKVNLTSATDVYSVGAIMLHAISGSKPVTSIERGNKPIVVPDFVPESLADVLAKAVSDNQLMRTADCKSFSDDLESFTSGKKTAKKGKGKNNKIIFALVTFVVVALGAILAILFSGNSGIKDFNSSGDVFPDLKGKTEEEVVDLLESVGLDESNYRIVGRLDNVDGKPGTVVDQNIEPGQKVKDNIIVELKIAVAEIVEADENSTSATMPYLIAMNENEARDALEKAGFTKFVFEIKVNGSYGDGLVCDQSVAADKVIEKDTPIVVYIAKNSHKDEQQANVQVTSATTLKAETTQNSQTTNTDKTTATATKAPSTTKRDSGKTSQKPKPDGDKTPQKPKPEPTTVKKVVVPDLMDKNPADAAKILKANGLVFDPKYEKSDTGPYGVVAKVSHTAGTMVDPNTCITCWFYE